MQKRAPVGQLIEGPARIVQDSPIAEFDLASRSHRDEESGNGIDDETKILSLPLQIEIKARVLERNCGLRRQQLQHGNPVGCESTRSEVVLQIECACKLSLLDDRQAEDGLGTLLPHIF